MISDWILTGISWGIMIASAAITVMAVLGFVIGVIGLLAGAISGGDDGGENPKNNKIRPV